jgi:two-component system nitrogen regulation sensor histidine kinase NtrY
LSSFKNYNFFRRNVYLLISAAWLFTLSFIINNYWSGTSTPFAVQKKIQRSINKTEEKIADLYKDSGLVRSVASQTYNERQLDLLVEKSYFLFFYKVTDSEDVPVFWNTQTIEPDSSVINEPDGIQFKKLINGWYVIDKRSYQSPDGPRYKIITLIPVKWDYYIQNKYLSNSFVAVEEIEKTYNISFIPTIHVVKDINGIPLFYLKQIGEDTQGHDNVLAMWLRILATILILFFIHTLANYIVEKTNFWYGIVFLTGSVFILRIVSYNLPVPLNFEQLELFKPTIYSANFILRSLGDLLINSLLFIWLVLFVRYHYRYDFLKTRFKTKFRRYATIVFISVLMVLITLMIGYVIRSLVADSQISFDVINFFTLNAYSVVGFIVLSCVSTGYFFLIQILLQPLNGLVGRANYLLYFFIAVSGLIMLTLKPHSLQLAFNLCLLMWLLIFIYLLNFKSLLLQAYKLISSRFVFWLFFFSISITAIIVLQNRTKELEERKHFAENLANKADPSGPAIVSIILTDFRNEYLSDIFYKFKNRAQNRFLKDSLINENFSGYLNKYDTKIYTFNEDELPLYNDDSTTFNSLNAIIKTQGKATDNPDLFYYDVSYDRFNYISKKEITDSVGNKQGYFFIVSKPKKYKSDALYPELFSKGNSNSIESSTVYAFAIYNKNQLSTSYNDYPFSTNIDNNTFAYNEFRTVQKNGYEELWYKANADKVIVIARQDRFFIESITLFAYLFCSFLFITIFFNLASKLLTQRRVWNAGSFWHFTIRNQVHGTIILISVFSFLVIGITTILFFISRYHSNNREKLSRTIHVMENELRGTIDTLSIEQFSLRRLDLASQKNLEAIINKVSNIHAADINLYDLNGDLKVSSVPLPYDKGIVSEKMDPVAYYHLSKLKDVQFFQEQQIGSLRYLSNYLPVRNESGQEYAYLNIPYFESQNRLQDEISNFLVTIINLNAFIFLIAGIIALFITNRITRSFSIISNKMKQINLETGNEEIVWNRNDEIGALVSEYNTMVRKLDVSAGKLAKSEREGAWREMARQVAHEIKNPLTPMKLNLQYLQMAIDNNSPDVKNISLYVAGILLEQIEHLSQIASDFAQFANIGNSKNQLFDINHLLENVITLYSTNDEIDIDADLYPFEILVKADKTQINRLFTNLLQNAVQSVPDFRSTLINIRSELVDNKVLISIKDNGNGIPESMHKKIFTPNFTTKTSGTGLGLAMCKGIVEKLNGRIWFETKETEWTCFFVEIPVAEE